MADRSAIEWTDASWNPIRARNLKTGKVGWHCEHATTGCEFCYAEGFNLRLGTGLPFKPGHRKDVEIFLSDEMLRLPLRWKKPRKIFVCSMTDPFADFVTDEMLDKMFAVMALCPQHTFQVLTKRAGRMREAVTRIGTSIKYYYLESHARALGRSLQWNVPSDIPSPLAGKIVGLVSWPLPNVWLGVSAERQQEADERIPLLLQTPAGIRFVSAEPLLGPIDLTRVRAPIDPIEPEAVWVFDSLALGDMYEQRCESGLGDVIYNTGDGPYRETKLDWVIAGGESGPSARASHPGWYRDLRDQCAAAGVAFHFKQHGEWSPSTPDQARGNPRSGWIANRAHPHVARAHELTPGLGAAFIERVGKKASGRLLDGVEHNEFPKVVLE